MINIMIHLMTYIMTKIMTNMTNLMINVMTAWKKVHSHSGQLSKFTGKPTFRQTHLSENQTGID
jgi:hypothetical protein